MKKLKRLMKYLQNQKKYIIMQKKLKKALRPARKNITDMKMVSIFWLM